MSPPGLLHTASIPDPAAIRPLESDAERVRILVCEPQTEVRDLLAHVVERLGHEPVFPVGRPDDTLPAGGADVVLVEPADAGARAAAEALLRRQEGIPVVCASIYPDSGQARGLRPVAYLVKPFALAELELALTAAVESVVPRG